MKKFIYGWLLVSSGYLAQAQVPGGGPGLAALAGSPAIKPELTTDVPRGNASISGIVSDSTLNKAVEFANVVLYNKVTNKPLDGVMADDIGKFTLGKIAPGDYKVQISFLGFSDKILDNIRLEKDYIRLEKDYIRLEKGQELNLGTVQALKEVTVTAQKARIEEKVDRLVYNDATRRKIRSVSNDDIKGGDDSGNGGQQTPGK